MSGRVFLSHSSADREPVEYVRRLIEAHGLVAYLAEHDPQPGRHLSEKVKEHIRSADAVIVLLTMASIDSRYVHQEIGAARMAAKLIVPLVHPDLVGQDLAMLNGAEFIVFDATDPTASTPDLVGQLSTIATKAQVRDALQALLVAGIVLGALYAASQV